MDVGKPTSDNEVLAYSILLLSPHHITHHRLKDNQLLKNGHEFDVSFLYATVQQRGQYRDLFQLIYIP